ncbi:hypothetical protein K432DRAFT_379589 [Lepidopterella palustris CBS 459.81]|uniref:RRM domain-containing protein n=1 Tax=Lepidopterella palustris CBS 459.81 TaxID=1314670 RepID=A0A8E2EGF5_9PEZI|nr:hypothetical protein K432DRAFT_379589 [Lepidopterella palustris CBS 459.81]
MASTVTIGKTYFEALLRRAEFHTSADEYDTPPHALSTNVTISKAEHDYLLQAAREYNILRSALFRGGLTPDTLDTLICGENEYCNGDTNADESWEEAFSRPNHVPVSMSMPHSNGLSPDASDSTAVGDGFLPKPRSYGLSRVHSFGPPGSSADTPPEQDDHLGFDTAEVQPSRTPFPKNDQRTLIFSNLSDRITHKDLVEIIRGGRLLDIYMRNDRSATVSFVEGAREFLAYAKRNDFYLHSKRIEIRWNDRQFHLPNHVANKISIGATRNLVIRGGAEKLTEECIRDDMDHIHNLVVIDVKFKDDDIYISTNSIHNALFARTCMMSRSAYKGLRIEWYPDECAAPIPARVPIPVSKPKATIPAPITNRFELLMMSEYE